MSVDASTFRFFEDIHLDGCTSTWIDQLLSNELPRLISKVQWPSASAGCMLGDFGNYLVRVLRILAILATNVLQSDLVSTYIDGRMQELVAEDDLHLANSLDDKHAALKQIASRLNQTSEDCERSWLLVSPIQSSVERRQNPELPEIQRQSFHGSSSPHATISIPSNRYPMSPQVGSSRNPHAFREHSNLPAVGPASAEAVDQEDEPSHAQNLAQVGASDSGQSPSSNTGSTENIPLMQQLKLRGKWSYRCPHRYNCVKGGVQPNGQLTVFERNSAFRAHLQLHERIYQCDLPGCPNTKGFARVDQLERHKKTVKHEAPGWVHEGAA